MHRGNVERQEVNRQSFAHTFAHQRMCACLMEKQMCRKRVGIRVELGARRRLTREGEQKENSEMSSAASDAATALPDRLTLPGTSSAHPMTLIPATRKNVFGSFCHARATLVRGPMAAMRTVPGGCLRRMSRMTSEACFSVSSSGDGTSAGTG